MPAVPLLSHWRQQLAEWARDGSLRAAATRALRLNDGRTPSKLSNLIADLADGETSGLPPVELLDAHSMPGAAGAYASSSGTIYLNRDWLRTATEEAALAVLTEEFGHHLDALLNAVDTPGDEGSTFSQLLINREQTPRSHNEPENDHGLINVNGATLQAEFAATSDLTLVFEDGAIGTIGRNPQKNNNVQLFSTLGIERIIFVQDDSDSNGEFGQQASAIVQGNDIPGTVKITTDNGNTYSISGAVVWNDKVGGNPVSFGILLAEDKTIVSSTGTTNLISGDTNNSSSNISINAVGASPGYSDGDNISGSAD